MGLLSLNTSILVAVSIYSLVMLLGIFSFSFGSWLLLITALCMISPYTFLFFKFLTTKSDVATSLEKVGIVTTSFLISFLGVFLCFFVLIENLSAIAFLCVPILQSILIFWLPRLFRQVLDVECQYHTSAQTLTAVVSIFNTKGD